MKLEWNGESETVYQVQMSTNLLSGEWINVGDPVNGTNATQYQLDSTRGNESKYYRVVDIQANIQPATELEWNAAPDVDYQVQMSTNAGIWHDIGAVVVGDGQTHYTLEPTHPADNKVYRVQKIN